MQDRLINLVAWLVGLVGFMDIISAIFPPIFARVEMLREFIPLTITDFSRTLTLIAGIFLVSLARGLAWRKHRAWVLSIILLSATLVFHLTKGLDFEEFLFTSLLLGIMVYTRKYFYVASDRLAVFTALKNLFITLLVLFAYASFGYIILQHHSVSLESIVENYTHETMGLGDDAIVVSSRWARWFESSVSLVSITAFSLTIFALFAPVFDTTRSLRTKRERLLALLEFGDLHEYAWYLLQPHKELWLDDSASHIVGYVYVGTYCIALPPVGTDDYGSTCWQFQQCMHARGYKVIWFGMDDPELATKLQLSAIKYGEAAIIPLDSFSLKGAAIAKVRHAVTHISREKVIYSWHDMDNLSIELEEEIRVLHTVWQGEKKGPKLTFSLSVYPWPKTSLGKILCLHSPTGELWAALSFFPYGRSGYTLDLMMHSNLAPNGAVEAAIAEASRHFKEFKSTSLNLGVAPLADITKSSHEEKIVTLLRNLIFEHGNKYYRYRTLYKFKNKFSPRWEPRYVFVPNLLGLPIHMTAVVGAHLKKPISNQYD